MIDKTDGTSAANDPLPTVPQGAAIQHIDGISAVIERVALDPGASIEKLEKMLEMKERLDAEAARKAFNSAFATASAEFPHIPLHGKGHNDMPYAKLKDILGGVRPVLTRHGLALTFSVASGDKTVTVTAELVHRDGYGRSTSITLPADHSGNKNAVQAVGSAQTYGQRYTAQALLGLSLGDDTDDDGTGAGTDTVTPEQFIKLRDLLELSQTPVAKLLQAYGAQSLEQFPAAKFNSARKRLQLTIDKANADA